MALPGPGRTEIEDSAHAIFTIVTISNAATGRIRQGFTSHFCKWVAARAKSYMDTKASSDPLVTSMQLRKTLNPFLAEFFAQALLRRLNIPTVPQIICSGEEARALGDNVVVKVAGREPAQSLEWKPEMARVGWCLASEIVEGAATLDYCARKIVTSHSAQTQVLRQIALLHAQKDIEIENLIARILGKECTPADRFFSEFRPTASEIEQIRSAMAIDGKKYLSIAAARIFLGSSAPHFANVLTTKDGTLISIDHARAAFEDGSDLFEMFYFVSRDSEAFKALAHVAALTEGDIRAAVSEIPRHPAVGSTAGLEDYFCARLHLWKKLHSEQILDSHSMTVDPSLMHSSLDTLAGHSVANEAIALARTWK
jgi:hypothetical protein